MTVLPHFEVLASILDTDPNWRRGDQVNVTRRFVVSAAFLSVAAVCTILLLLPFVYSAVTPAPFEYRNLPFTVCAPGSTAVDCRAIDDNDAFKPGDIVPFIVDRCATDPFARSAQLPYVVSRNVVNDESGTRIILPSLSTEIPAGGCARTITVAHQLPESIAPGRYFLEGVATVFGRFRTVNAYFRTEAFNVEKP